MIFLILCFGICVSLQRPWAQARGPPSPRRRYLWRGRWPGARWGRGHALGSGTPGRCHPAGAAAAPSGRWRFCSPRCSTDTSYWKVEEEKNHETPLISFNSNPWLTLFPLSLCLISRLLRSRQLCYHLLYTCSFTTKMSFRFYFSLSVIIIKFLQLGSCKCFDCSPYKTEHPWWQQKQKPREKRYTRNPQTKVHKHLSNTASA